MPQYKKSTNVFSPISPEWITFGEDKDYPDSFWTIISFYVLHSLCQGQSNKQHTLCETYLWKPNPWTRNEYLKDKLNNAIWQEEESRMYMAESRTKFEGKIWGKQLGQDFYLDLSTQRMGYVMVSDNTNRSQYMSFFYHLRNGLAHGRFGIVPLPREDYMIIVEDGEAKKNLFEVTARMVIKASSLLAIREIIITGPDEDIDYGREIIDSINKGNTNKRTVMADIMISENIWDREIQKLRLNGEVFFEGGKWNLVKC